MTTITLERRTRGTRRKVNRNPQTIEKNKPNAFMIYCDEITGELNVLIGSKVITMPLPDCYKNSLDLSITSLLS